MPPRTQNTAQLLDSHGPLVMKIIWHLVPTKYDAQDIFQDTFLQHHLAFTKGHVINNPKAWLCQTARNAAFKWRKSRMQTTPIAEGMLDQHPAKSLNPNHFLMLEKIRNLAATFPERQGQVFVMRNFEQMSYAEISDQLGCSEEAARASGYKALKKIRSIMSDRQEGYHV